MPSFENLEGKHFGNLTVLYRADDYIQPSGQHKRMWHCKCKCGTECDIRANDLKSGNTSSCGCQSSRKKSIGLIDFTGKEYGDYVVIGRAPNRITPSGQQTRIWNCKCLKCGLEKQIQASQFKKGKFVCVCNKHSNKKKKEIVNLAGVSFGKLIVIELDDTKKNRRYWKCKCECGRENVSVQEHLLRKSIVTSCGCDKRKKASLNDKKNRTTTFEQSLATINPKLASEWNYEKNGELLPSEVSCKSSLKVWWKDELAHEWEATIYSRVAGNGCPICSNRRLLTGFNDIETLYPEILSEWDYERNELLPSEISSKNKVVWWKCPTGHSYEMRISLRVGTQRCGCPYCSKPAKKVLKGFNDFATLHPELLVQWDYEKNTVSPDEVLAGSSVMIWWKCKQGHSYQQRLVYRSTSELVSTCPYCSHQKLLKGFNDLETTHAYILNEWDYEKNTVLPSEIGVGSHYKAWWICPFGHSYQAYPSNRCGKTHSGCSICDKENHTSFPEQALLYYIKRMFPDAINGDREMVGLELDIYIPSIDVAIEYDGYRWHGREDVEVRKNFLCKSKGIKLIRIREEGLKLYDDCICIERTDFKSSSSLNSVIKSVLVQLGVKDLEPNVDEDASQIYGLYIEGRKSKCLANVYPYIAAEWHPSKNGNLTPMMVAPYTSKKVWWLGSCGHEYQMKVGDRTNLNCSCPYCAGKRVLFGFNDLKSRFPELILEWDYDKNKDILPENVTSSSDKKVWWKCAECGNEWLAKIDGRTRMHSGCPVCGRERAAKKKQKKVINIDTGEIFDSLIEAEKVTGISRSGIANVCKGKQYRAGKYRWEYWQEDESAKR